MCESTNVLILRKENIDCFQRKPSINKSAINHVCSVIVCFFPVLPKRDRLQTIPESLWCSCALLSGTADNQTIGECLGDRHLVCRCTLYGGAPYLGGVFKECYQCSSKRRVVNVESRYGALSRLVSLPMSFHDLGQSNRTLLTCR